MEEKSIILVGNPDSGKSNYIGRLWLALKSKKHNLTTASAPNDIRYVENITAHLLQAQFAPRTEKEESDREFKVAIQTATGEHANLIIPDVSGELWKKAVDTLEITPKWLDTLKGANRALLFVRISSESIIEPRDWVTAKQILELGFADSDNNKDLPTQVSLIELLRILEDNLATSDNTRPKVAIIVSAWDLLHEDDAQNGPIAYLEENYPLFAGRLQDTDSVEVKVFGSSILGGDLTLEEFQKEYLNNDIDDLGYIISTNADGKPEKINDITAPIAWLLG